MAFYGSFPSNGGPNDPVPPQFSPQQLFLALQQFGVVPQMAAAAPRLPSSSHPNSTAVIDPVLQNASSVDTEERIRTLEREVRDLKAAKRANPDNSESSPKRRKKSKKISPYILKEAKNLSGEQKEVRKYLMVRSRLSSARTKNFTRRRERSKQKS